jgi:cation diffusion facilitator family transporter
MSKGTSKLKIRIMAIMLVLSVLLSSLKFLAWHLTHSNAVLTDALESIINVVAGSFALFSIYYAARPKDDDHPYGHGKIEFLSAGFEGGLIFISGLLIIAKASYSFFIPYQIHELDTGLYLLAFTAICNWIMGIYLVKAGKKYNSVLMLADGNHLITDTISSGGLILGLILMYFTGKEWIDNVIALLYGGFIFRMGYKLLKSSINSLLDEADHEKLKQLIDLLNARRRNKWIDIHNLRVLKYGAHLHIDCHLTLPWYDTLEEAHNEVSAVEALIKNEMEGEMEFFIHSDPCLPASCQICCLDSCKVRKFNFVKKLEWSMENMLPDKKHSLDS